MKTISYRTQRRIISFLNYTGTLLLIYVLVCIGLVFYLLITTAVAFTFDVLVLDRDFTFGNATHIWSFFLPAILSVAISIYFVVTRDER